MTEDLYKDLSKWQAYSHPHLANKDVEELLLPDDAKRYKAMHDNLWYRLIHVHESIVALETLQKVANGGLHGTEEFWDLVRMNFGGMAIVMLNALLSDSGTDSLTIRRLGNLLKTKGGFKWQDEEARDMLTRELKERRFDAHLKELAEHVKQIRNSVIAHVLIDPQTALPKDVMPEITLAELRKLYDATQLLFGAITLGGSRLTLSGDFIPAVSNGQRVPNPLDRVLDAVLKDNDWVNMPERHPDRWYWIRKCKPETVARVNELRKRIGLPEA